MALTQRPARAQFFQGTYPKPSPSDIHRAIFGFNSDNSKAVPEALREAAKAPAPATGRKLLQAHDETVRRPLPSSTSVSCSCAWRLERAPA